MERQSWQPFVGELKQALASRDRDAANGAVSNLLDCRAPIGTQWKAIAELMRVSGEFTLAHRAMDAFVRSLSNAPQALFSKVVLNTQTGRLREAHDLLSKLPPHIPDPAGHAYVMGNTAMTLGKVEEARVHLEKAVSHRPGWGPAWLTLAAAVNFADDGLGERLLADEMHATCQQPGDYARYLYAVGKLHADRKDPDAAFAAFSKGAALLSGERAYSRAGNAQNAAAAMTGFNGRIIEDMNARQENGTSRSIFVTGLPRSGTTLVEQILASHSQVQDGGELNIMQHLAVEAGGNSGAHLQKYLDGAARSDTLARLYLHLLAERFGESGRIVDKTIDASRFLGLIAAALPEAPLIWMRRDPLDSAWSCFRTFFIHGVAWSYNLTDIAHHFQLEDRLLTYWKERLGDRLLVIPYRALIDDSQKWTRRLLKHCNLKEEAAVFAPHETRRAVATASALQVRKPINRDGLNVSENYRTHLAPFVKAYSA